MMAEGEEIYIEFPDKVNVSISGSEKIPISLDRNTKAFIVECSMRLYASINFEYEKKSNRSIAKTCVERALAMASALQSAGVLS